MDHSTAAPVKGSRRGYTLGEEIANSIIHGMGVGLSIAALTALIIFAVQRGGGAKLASAIVFGVALVLEYTASTLYHSFPQPRVKHIFKVLDHAGIYALIAGSYTPFTLVTMKETGGWWMFALVWTLAIAGISTEAFWTYRPRWLSAAVYLAMGWVVVLAIRPLMDGLDPRGLNLLIAGGLAYTGGTLFYVLQRFKYFHAVWHVFVLAGSVCHFLAVAIYVI